MAMSEETPQVAPDGAPIPTVTLTGPPELVGPAGRIKVNEKDVEMYLAQGYTRVTASEEPPHADPPADPDAGGSDGD